MTAAFPFSAFPCQDSIRFVSLLTFLIALLLFPCLHRFTFYTNAEPKPNIIFILFELRLESAARTKLLESLGTLKLRCCKMGVRITHATQASKVPHFAGVIASRYLSRSYYIYQSVSPSKQLLLAKINSPRLLLELLPSRCSS